MSESFRGVEDTPPDVTGTWTITLEGGPALAGNLAGIVRVAVSKQWRAGGGADAAIGRLIAALERAEFTPDRP